MSPRAAWQLEAMGFRDVYDFANGKVEWILSGLPIEGGGPHYAMAGEVATAESAVTCKLGERIGEVRGRLEGRSDTFCVVLNDQDVVLGRIGRSQLDADPATPVEEVMQSGPTTVRPTEPAAALLDRMAKRKVTSVVVTSKRGEFVGLARREDLERLVARSS